jgi:signal transduction histidine kinase
MPVFRNVFISLFVLIFSTVISRAHGLLETVADARSLPVAPASEGRAVRLSGVVTYLRDIPQDFNFNIHDATGGVMVYPVERMALRPGQRVIVTGIVAFSVHGLRIASARVEAGGMATLPKPVNATMGEVLDGRHEGMFAEVEGVIRVVRLESPEIQPQRLALDFGARGRRLSVWVSDYADAKTRFLPGAKVRARGVVVRWKNPRGQTNSVNILVNTAADITDIAPPVAPPLQTIADVQSWSSPDEPAMRVTASGIVTFYRRGELLVLQEGDRAIRVRSSEADSFSRAESDVLKSGDRLTVTGFPVLGEYTVEIEDAHFSRPESGPAIAVERYENAAAVLKAHGLVDRDARRIGVEGTLRAIRESDGRRALELESGKRSFTAWLPLDAPLPAGLRIDAGLLVDGICNLHLSPLQRRLGRLPDQFSLTLGSAEDIRILRPAPWWTSRHLLTALGVLAVAAILMAAWAAALRKRNARLQQEIAARRQAEHELANERRRVAAELHDTLEQTLVAAALQLNAASRTIAARPESAAAQVALAHQLVSRSRQEVRDAVWDLRLDSAHPQSLSEMLRQTCTESSSQSSAEVTFFAEGNERPLPALVVAQVIRIVRECIANALKHASPNSIRVLHIMTEDALEISVSDDGSGFDPVSAAGPETGHFGLSGMRERVQRLGGELTLKSSKGSGTTIRLKFSTP